MLLNKRLLLIVLLYIECTVSYSADTKYFTCLNEFEGFKKEYCALDGKCLRLSNKSNDKVFNVEAYDINDNTNIYIRFSNLNNKEDKQTIVQDKNGSIVKIENPEWGLVWNYVDELNYCAVKLRGYKSIQYDDILNDRCLIVELIKVTNGFEQMLYENKVRENVNLNDGFNVLMIESKGPSLNVYIGNHELSLVCSSSNVIVEPNSKFGYYSGPGSDVCVERIVISSAIDNKNKLVTKWTKREINSYIQSIEGNFIEGFWEYLDRDLDDKRLKLGGKYTIAILKNEKMGYDVLYYEGAMVNSSNWRCGMLKARLVPTIFEGNYNLVWYDAMMNELKDDTYVQYDGVNIITFYFPTDKSQIRFVKH